jgi:hypothetical protein
MVPCALFAKLAGATVTDSFVRWAGSSRDLGAFHRKHRCLFEHLAAHLGGATAQNVHTALSELQRGTEIVCSFRPGFCGTMFSSAEAAGRNNALLDLLFAPGGIPKHDKAAARRAAQHAGVKLNVAARVPRYAAIVAEHAPVVGRAACEMAKLQDHRLEPQECTELATAAAWQSLSATLRTYAWATSDGVCQSDDGKPFCR